MAINAGILQLADLEKLFEALIAQQYTLIGPKVEGKCITYGNINQVTDLPQGWTDEQEKGTYRLKKREDNAYFGYNIGTRSFKDFLFPPREKIFEIDKSNPTQVLSFTNTPRYAFIGVRACELAAIAIQDKVFAKAPFQDNNYVNRREAAFIVSLNCHTAAKTCFCDSMKTGPEVKQGFDLNLNEILTENEHYFIVESNSDKGKMIFDGLPLKKITENDKKRKKDMIEKTRQSQHRKIDNHNIKEDLYQSHEHPHWEKVAERCLNCTNCTLVCPTCFCSKNEDITTLEQDKTSRHKIWDSCFSQEFTTIHDSTVRSSGKSRYRQWLTHKLGSWHDQFDTSGCVGCGRCITWCPVGIDLTEEIAALRENNEEHS